MNHNWLVWKKGEEPEKNGYRARGFVAEWRCEYCGMHRKRGQKVEAICDDSLSHDSCDRYTRGLGPAKLPEDRQWKCADDDKATPLMKRRICKVSEYNDHNLKISELAERFDVTQLAIKSALIGGGMYGAWKAKRDVRAWYENDSDKRCKRGRRDARS